MSKIVCFGEVLWDVFSTHKKVGGAPLNVAMRLQSFENEVAMISRIGNDEEGKELLHFIDEKGLNRTYIQVDTEHKTGSVAVTLNVKGTATYEILFPSSWDFIEINTNTKALVKNSDAFIFGSLIARNKVAKESLFQLLKVANYTVFDVNLRAPHYTKEVLVLLMQQADFIKFNDDELFEISGYLGSKYNCIEQNIEYISEKTNTKHICVTKGSHGAVLLYNDALYYNSGYLIKVVDTVGAGDSFLATLIHFLLQKENPQKAIDTACAMGALVAQNKGANPVISSQELHAFISPYL